MVVIDMLRFKKIEGQQGLLFSSDKFQPAVFTGF